MAHIRGAYIRSVIQITSYLYGPWSFIMLDDAVLAVETFWCSSIWRMTVIDDSVSVMTCVLADSNIRFHERCSNCLDVDSNCESCSPLSDSHLKDDVLG